MSGAARPPRILVVDDDGALRDFLAMFLHAEGYAVAVAAHGREALDHIDQDTPDLVLTDLQMPVMGGEVLCTELRQRAPGLPVIFMSAGTDPSHAAERCGALAGLAKPFDLDTLLALINCVAAPAASADGLSGNVGKAVP